MTIIINPPHPHPHPLTPPPPHNPTPSQYAVVLGLLVLVEIGGGIAAAVKKDDVRMMSPFCFICVPIPFHGVPVPFQIEELFRTSSNKTFLQYLEDSTKQDTWDRFQQSVSHMHAHACTCTCVKINVHVHVYNMGSVLVHDSLSCV